MITGGKLICQELRKGIKLEIIIKYWAELDLNQRKLC